MDETEVGAYDAKTHLPRLLERVQRGATVTITKHGRAVAKIVPVTVTAPKPDDVITALRATRAGVHRGTDSLRFTIDDVPPEPNALVAIGRRHQLSAYDAAYLLLAEQRGAPLATLDERLAAAAKAAGVPLVMST